MSALPEPQTPIKRLATPRGRSFPSARAILALVLREMSTTYGRSPGGYLWAFIQPIAGIALLSAIFSLGFKTPRIGTNFAIFYATGLIPFMMALDLASKMAASISFSRALLNYPAVTFVDALVGRFIVNILTQLLVAYVVLTGIILIFDTKTVVDFPIVVNGFCLAIVLGVGIGTLNCFLFTMFPVWQVTWSILTRPLVLISGVIFIYDFVPEPYASYLWYNPFVHVVGEVRKGFYPGYHALYVSSLYAYGVGLACLILGLIFLSRYHRDLVNRERGG